MKWPFKRKPLASEVVKAVFELLTEEEVQRMYSDDPIVGEGRSDIRKVIERITPEGKAQRSMEECLKIAKDEFEVIRDMPLYDARYQMIKMFALYLF